MTCEKVKINCDNTHAHNDMQGIAYVNVIIVEAIVRYSFKYDNYTEKISTVAFTPVFHELK